DNCARVNKHLRDSLLFTSEKTSMLTKGSALNVGKGWAVASLFRKARENRLTKFYLKTVGAFLFAFLVTHPAFASGTDLLASQNTTVNSTFGSGSSIVKWFYLGEILFGVFIYMKTRSPLTFLGVPLVIIATRIGFAIAS
ncbi:type IV conjugative transfer system pilin TraA, partial [Enterobacter hormaechei subsp. xiangfangensis]